MGFYIFHVSLKGDEVLSPPNPPSPRASSEKILSVGGEANCAKSGVGEKFSECLRRRECGKVPREQNFSMSEGPCSLPRAP